MNAKKTTVPWLETVITAALLYGVATHADAQRVSSGANLSPARAAHALTADQSIHLSTSTTTPMTRAPASR